MLATQADGQEGGVYPVKSVSYATGIVLSVSLVTASIHFDLQASGSVSRSGQEASAIEFPTLGTQAEGEAVLLAIDDYSLAIKKNLCFYLSKPKVYKEPVLKPSRDNPKAPDQAGAIVYGTVLFEEGRFRMWYYGAHYGSGPTDEKQGPVCYAESEDGIHWIKPNLGQLEFKGSRDNNALKLPDEKTQGPFVIKDKRDPDPKRRYKMIYNAHNGRTWVFRTATSPDGTQWTFSPDFAVDRFIELSSFYKHNGLYVANGQSAESGQGGGSQGRQGYARISADFRHWLGEAVGAFALPEPAQAADRGKTKPYDQVHLGVGGKSLGNVVVGLYGLWHNRPGDPTRKIRDAWFGDGKTSCDLGLVVSNDGIHFREPVKEHVFLSRFDSPVTPIEGKSYPTILCQSGNAILNVGDKTLVYHGRWRNAAYGSDLWYEIALATLPRDRWGALGFCTPPQRHRSTTPESGAERSEGSVWSVPVRLPEAPCTLALNADAAKAMQVEIADTGFHLLPDFSGKHSGRTQKVGGLDCPVSWPKGSLATLQGKTVRLRIRLTKSADADPRLYAVYIRSKE